MIDVFYVLSGSQINALNQGHTLRLSFWSEAFSLGPEVDFLSLVELGFLESRSGSGRGQHVRVVCALPPAALSLWSSAV